jgi:hypothetical protein
MLESCDKSCQLLRAARYSVGNHTVPPAEIWMDARCFYAVVSPDLSRSFNFSTIDSRTFSLSMLSSAKLSTLAGILAGLRARVVGLDRTELLAMRLPAANRKLKVSPS